MRPTGLSFNEFYGSFPVAVFVVVIAPLRLIGCSSRPSAIAPPDIEPGELAAAAIKQYDKNGDAVIDNKELEAAPSIRFSLDRIDANGDNKILSEEISQFAQKHWVDTPVGIVRVQCVVNVKGRPLDGATVTLEPEAFMQGVVSSATGVTRGGTAALDVSDATRPHPNAHGVQSGLYLVRVSKVVNGKETIPPKYNAQTVLGCEVARARAICLVHSCSIFELLPRTDLGSASQKSAESFPCQVDVLLIA